MSLLSAWDLPEDSQIIPYEHCPLRATSAFEVLSGSKRYMLFNFPADRRESLLHSIHVANEANTLGIPTVLPIRTQQNEFDSLSDDTFSILYPHVGLTLAKVNLLSDERFASLFGHIFARLPLISPVTHLLPPSTLFSPVFQESLLSLVKEEDPLDIILDILEYLRKNFEPVLPFLDQEFVHGDLHPGNLFEHKGEILLHDWEYARQELCLYDVMFLLGCLNLIADLTSPWTLQLLRTYSAERPLTRLTAENAFELLLCTRLHWLHLWLSQGDALQVSQEAEYLKSLLSQAEVICTAWKDVWILKKPIQKWIITDAVIPAHLQAWLSAHTMELVADLPFEEWPLLMIALGKAGRLSDMIRWIDQLVDSWFQAELKLPLEILTQMMANLSLDLAKNLQKVALYRLKTMLEWMQDEATDSEYILVARAYVQRNLSTLLGELGEALACYTEIEVLAVLYETHPEQPAIAEEMELPRIQHSAKA